MKADSMNLFTLFDIKFIKFIFWGGLNTTLSIALYSVIVYFGVSIWIANLFANILGVLLGHYLNKNLVFKSSRKKTLALYFTMWAGLYLISTIIIIFFIHIGFNKYIAAIFSGALLVPIAFIVQKLRIFSY